MYSTFHGLEIGKRAILSQQTALSVTGYNIANANTKGYTRQEAVLNATLPLSSPGMQNGTTPMQKGTGVEVSEFRRIREGYLDKQFHSHSQEAGYWEARSTSLSELESVFDGLSETGVSASIQKFWQSLQELAKKPDNLSLRAVAVASGKDVADQLNKIHADIAQIETSMSYQLTAKANEITVTANEIAALNLKIAQVTAGGNQANDLMDRRDLLLDQLSSLVKIEPSPGKNGQMHVTIDGVQLVNGKDSAGFTIDPVTGEAKVGDSTISLTGGALKGLLDTRNETIPDLRAKIDAMATAIAESMNGIHSAENARSLEYFEMNTPPEKLLFFVDKDDPNQPPASADRMVINPKLMNFPAKLAAAASDSIGDGTNVLAMSEALLGKMNINGTNASPAEFFNLLAGQLGTELRTALDWSGNADALLQQTDNQRQSISGVSTDEELTNMVKYQQAYNAAARYVSAVNELLNTLINGMK
ncbi:flagellar hook-associated protein FlgK [Neobacillus notoginsengisoli]|uniref:Flagellar hook-associated protein 1 n=1 Tax=Neobacillus notoginsengisoli TaxID=1578198 RepID=A0A417YK10_9BACI|nr:flagellar hook-associated protein FlgK [Neobacillus notoginsengisoli]RHW33325.1 flagellar hook-associated protein FlgK [Neobacillus notoginsengisoli]